MGPIYIIYASVNKQVFFFSFAYNYIDVRIRGECAALLAPNEFRAAEQK